MKVILPIYEELYEEVILGIKKAGLARLND
jgi:hypothetical protein